MHGTAQRIWIPRDGKCFSAPEEGLRTSGAPSTSNRMTDAVAEALQPIAERHLHPLRLLRGQDAAPGAGGARSNMISMQEARRSKNKSLPMPATRSKHCLFFASSILLRCFSSLKSAPILMHSSKLMPRPICRQLTHFCLLKRGRRVATAQRRLESEDLVSLGNIPFGKFSEERFTTVRSFLSKAERGANHLQQH